jgi:ABC-type dipeptide/oligopeptide/nickel transport system permease subunit
VTCAHVARSNSTKHRGTVETGVAWVAQFERVREGDTTPPRPVGPWRLGWRRLRRDRWGLFSLVVLCVILLLALFGAAALTRLVGHNGQTPFPYAASLTGKRPVGPWTRVAALTTPRVDEYGGPLPLPRGTKTTLLVLGADGPLGRDEAIRLFDGMRTSLEIGLLAAVVAVLVALPVGTVAGYFGGRVDDVVSTLTESIMAFPLLLFLVYANRFLLNDFGALSWSWVLPAGVVGESVLIGAVTSFYPLRLVRAQLLVLRHAEFVEAARMVGASDRRIMRRHLLPHLVPTLLVWGAIAVGTNMLVEVGLSFLGLGVDPSIPTLGTLLSTVWGTIFNPNTYNSHSYTPWQTIFPMAAMVITVVCLNRFADAVRSALEPRATR